MRKNPFVFQTLAALLLALCLALSGCGNPTVVGTKPENRGDLPPEEEAVKTEFTREDFLEDYDQLWADLEENYPFFPVLEDKGIDVEGLRRSRREMLEARVTDLEGFVWLLNNLFQEMEFFAHLSLIKPELLHLYVSTYETGKAESLHPWYELSSAPQTAATYSQLYGPGTGPSSAGTDAKPEAQPSGEAGPSSAVTRYPPVETRYLPEEKAAYFHFFSFDDSLMERDSAVVGEYLASLGEVELEHIILDITGNQGGNTQYWTDHIVPYLGETTPWRSDVFLCDTPVNQRFFYPYCQVEPISSLPEGYTLPEFVEELGLTHYLSTYLTFPPAEGPHPTARRWLLVDKQVYSSSDAFAGFCKDTGWATLVGTSTLGDGDTLSPVALDLKNTGLLVRFSSTVSANSEGLLNQLYGTSPDILSKPSESPLDTVLRVIRYDREG